MGNGPGVLLSAVLHSQSQRMTLFHVFTVLYLFVDVYFTEGGDITLLLVAVY